MQAVSTAAEPMSNENNNKNVNNKNSNYNNKDKLDTWFETFDTKDLSVAIRELLDGNIFDPMAPTNTSAVNISHPHTNTNTNNTQNSINNVIHDENKINDSNMNNNNTNTNTRDYSVPKSGYPNNNNDRDSSTASNGFTLHQRRRPTFGAGYLAPIPEQTNLQHGTAVVSNIIPATTMTLANGNNNGINSTMHMNGNQHVSNSRKICFLGWFGCDNAGTYKYSYQCPYTCSSQGGGWIVPGITPLVAKSVVRFDFTSVGMIVFGIKLSGAKCDVCGKEMDYICTLGNEQDMKNHCQRFEMHLDTNMYENITDEMTCKQKRLLLKTWAQETRLIVNCAQKMVA